MAYDKQTWVNGETITEAKLNHIEGGVEGMNSIYEKQTWVTGEVITADKLNHIEEGIANGSRIAYAPSDTGVTLRDYDGTVLGYYTNEEFNALTELPNPPAPQGLVATGWTATLEEAKASLAENGVVALGRMYETASGATEIDIVLPEEIKSPTLGLGLNGTATIDWGDDSAEETVTGTSLTTLTNTQHQYASGGNYTIKVTVTSGEMNLRGDGDYGTRLLYDPNDAMSNVYITAIKEVRIGNSVTSIGNNALEYCYNLTSVVIPDSVTIIEHNAFSNCYSLVSVVIPKGVTSIEGNAFQYCYNLVSVVIPDSVTSIGTNAFNNCRRLVSVVIPEGVTSIGGQAFNNCSSLVSVVIPEGVTSIKNNTFNMCYNLVSVVIPEGVTSTETNAFMNCSSLVSVVIPDSVTSIDGNTFSNCRSLTSVVIPDSVTSIGGGAFSMCLSLASIKFENATPPTLGNSTFGPLPTGCVIKVPTGSLSAYTSASNYPSSSTYTYVEY